MMGTKQKLNAVECDVVYARKRYCYLMNNCKNVKFAKRQMRKRMRIENKQYTMQEMENM